MARTPTQEDELLNQADESLNESDNPIEIDGVVGDSQQEVKPQPSSHVNTDAIARLVAGATPTLMGFLMGSSPAMAANQIAQTKQMYEAGKPKKLVTIIGPDGQPVYEDSAMAVGEQAYQKPMRPSAAGISETTYRDKNTGKQMIGFADKMKMKVYDTNGRVIENPEKYNAPTLKEVEDEKGTKKLVGFEQETLNPLKTITYYKGKGQQYGIREDDAKIGDSMAKEVLQKSQPIYDTKANIKGAMDLLNTDPSRAIEQAAGIFKTSKIVTAEKISNEEKQYVSEAPSLFQRYADQLATNISGEQRQYIISQMRNILSKLDNVNDHALAAMQDRYVTTFAGNSSTKDEYKKKYDYLANQIVKAPMMDIREPTAPTKPFNPQAPSKNKGIKNITPEQFSVLPRAQKERLIQELEKQRELEKQKKLQNQQSGR